MHLIISPSRSSTSPSPSSSIKSVYLKQNITLQVKHLLKSNFHLTLDFLWVTFLLIQVSLKLAQNVKWLPFCLLILGERKKYLRLLSTYTVSLFCWSILVCFIWTWKSEFLRVPSRKRSTKTRPYVRFPSWEVGGNPTTCSSWLMAAVTSCSTEFLSVCVLLKQLHTSSCQSLRRWHLHMQNPA